MIETDDPAIELEKLKLMKILNNLSIRCIMNIHKIIINYQEVKVYCILAGPRSSQPISLHHDFYMCVQHLLLSLRPTLILMKGMES